MEIKQYLPTYKETFKNDSRWLNKETEHYIFHYFPNSVAEKEIDYIINLQELSYKKIINFLEVPTPKTKIKYYLYPGTKIKKELMGDDWYAQAMYKDYIVHVLYTEEIKPIGEHEDTHLLSLPWGLSIGFFQEGLAEYMVGHGWHGENHDELTLEAYKKNILPNIESMMEHSKWMNLDDEYALYYYCFAGSFIKFLIEKYGKEKFKKLYGSTNRNNSKKENIHSFISIYGVIPSVVEERWKIDIFGR